MLIPRVNITGNSPHDICVVPATTASALLNNCNWPEEYPYIPDASVRIAHCGDALLLYFDVTENCCAAIVDNDNGDVWTDSCVEFFIEFDGDEGYYNIEANCIGRVLMAHRLGKNTGVELATPDILATIGRNPSLGRSTFAERKGPVAWNLALRIPASAFFRHNLSDLSGLHARCNIYKCGDGLSRPHYISWKAIPTASPDFHRPEFFADIKFE